MNVGLIIYGRLDTLTGGYIYDRRLVDHLRSIGYRVDVISLPDRVYPLRVLDNFSIGRLARFCGSRLDMLLQDELCHPSFFLQYWQRGKRSGLPAIAIVHHLTSGEARSPAANIIVQMIEKRYLDAVDGFIFNSQTTRDDVFRLSRRPRPCVVAPPGKDRVDGCMTAAEVDFRARRPGPLRLLYVGLVIPRKGLLELVRALRWVPRNRWRLDVVGSLTASPGYVRRIKKIIRTHRLMSSIQFHGTVSKDALSAAYTGAQILCMPFAYEGFGIVAAEAMTLGLPVMGSTSGAMGKQIENGVTGLLFPKDGAHAVAAAVEQFYADRQYLARLSRAALRSSQRLPTWSQSMRRIEEFFRRFQ